MLLKKSVESWNLGNKDAYQYRIFYVNVTTVYVYGKQSKLTRARHKMRQMGKIDNYMLKS